MAKLGYLSGHVLDPMVGEWGWWKDFTPDKLTAHDLYKLDGVDARCLPHLANTFDAVALDSPYVSAGGRKTTTINAFHDRYGTGEAPRTPALLQTNLINPVIKEAERVLVPGGFLLVKVMDYVSGGKLFPGVFRTHLYAVSLKLRYQDVFVHLGDPGPQPEHSTQQHARSNMSTLLVFQKPKVRGWHRGTKRQSSSTCATTAEASTQTAGG